MLIIYFFLFYASVTFLCWESSRQNANADLLYWWTETQQSGDWANLQQRHLCFRRTQGRQTGRLDITQNYLIILYSIYSNNENLDLVSSSMDFTRSLSLWPPAVWILFRAVHSHVLRRSVNMHLGVRNRRAAVWESNQLLWLAVTFHPLAKLFRSRAVNKVTEGDGDSSEKQQT